MQNEYRLAIIIDANGEALIAELDAATGEIKKTRKAADLMGKSTEEAGKKAERGGKGVKRFADQTQKMKSHIRGALGILAKMGGLITGALGASLAIGATRTIEFGDQIAKMSQRIGASTEALSEYQHVAKLTGVEFNQLTTAWQRQARRVSEAARGFGEAQGALRELGLDAKSLKDLAPEDQFEIIADRMAGVTAESDRVRLAMRLWDTEGVALLQTIDGGSESLRKMRQEARDLGKTITNEQAQAMVEAKNATTKLQGAIDGLNTRLAIEFAPTLANIAGFISDVVVPSFVDWLIVIGAVDVAISEMNRSQVNERRENLRDDIDLLQQFLDKVEADSKKSYLPGFAYVAPDGVEASKTKLAELRGELEQVDARIAQLDQTASAGAEYLKRFGQGAEAAGAGVSNLSGATSSLLAQLAGESSAVQQFVGGLEQQVQTLGLSEEATVRLTAEQIKAQLQNKELAAAIDDLVDQYLAGAQAAERSEQAEQALTKARATQASVLTQLKQRYDPVNAAIEQWNAVEAEMLTLLNDETVDQEQLALTLEYVARAREDAAHAAELQLDPAKALIEKLEQENEVLQLAIANNETLEIAQLRQAGATDVQIAKAKAMQQEQAALNLQYKAGTQDIATLATAVENSVKRMDDVFYDFVRGAIGGWDDMLNASKNALHALKNLFLDTLAEMIHAAFTRPIVVQFTTALTGLTGSGLAAAGGGAGGVGGAAGSVGGFSGVLSGLTSMFTGNSIGQGFAGIPIGAPGGSFSTLFGGGANEANWQFGIAGILGGILGDKIFGGQGGLGGSLGAVIGTAILPGIGSVVGGLLGGALGGLFGRQRDPVLDVSGVSRADVSNSDDDAFFDSAFGGAYITSRRLDSDTIAQFGNAIAQFDNSIAQFVDADQAALITDTLTSFRDLTRGKDISLEDLLTSRFAAIKGTFDEDVQRYVNGVAGLEDQVERLAAAAVTQKLMAENQELFGDRTFTEVVNAAEQIRGAGEDVNTALMRLVSDMQAAALATQVLTELGATDPFEVVRQQKELANRTLLQSLDPLEAALRTAMDDFDGTAASLVRTAEAATSLKVAQIALAGQYDQLADQIAGFGLSIEERIRKEMLGPEGYRDLLESRLAGERQRLLTLTDPQQISDSLQQLEGIVSDLFNTMSADEIKALGPAFLAMLDDIRADADAQRQAGMDDLAARSDATGSAIDNFSDGLGDPLELAVGGLSTSATELSDTASQWRGIGDQWRGIGDQFGQAIISSTRDSSTIATNTAAAVNQQLGGLAAGIIRAIQVGLSNAVVQMPAQSRPLNNA